MGYYASCSGDIVLRNIKNEDEILKEAGNCFEDCYEIAGDTFSVYGDHSKYHEEDFYDFFKKLNELAEVVEGELDLIGEDDNQWRFIYNPATKDWDEQNGYVYYKKNGNSPSYEELLQMFVDYVSNDAEGAGDPNYIIKALEQVGCNKATRKALGLNFVE